MPHITRPRTFALTLLMTVLLLTTFTGATNMDGTSGEQELNRLLARFDHMADRAERDALERRIDAVAHQRYATVSRLFWHTDLATAKRVARASGRPILHLRLLGRLEEELSCANSRLFRATLYANQDVATFLREHFVLSWSSERPVPRVTIDYGDGRKIERTTTGNSAHYVLDADGSVLDVLPGLYAPIAFRRELERSLELAARVRGGSGAERQALIAAYHHALVRSAEQQWATLAGTPWVAGARELLTPSRVESELAAAQMATLSKARMELPDLRLFAPGLAPASIPEERTEMWASVGQMLYGIGNLKPITMRPLPLSSNIVEPRERTRPAVSPQVLDHASRQLVMRLQNAVDLNEHDAEARAARTVARLEQTIVADTALNQLRLRPQISREIARLGGFAPFDSLNTWIYAEVFRTPRQDAWLGLLPRDVFTGLPGDGVVLR